MKKAIIFILIFGTILLLLIALDVFQLWVIIILSLLMIFISVGMVGTEQEKEKKIALEKLNNDLNTIKDFEPSEKYITLSGIIAIDEEREKIAIKEGKNQIDILPYKDILKTEIIENNQILNQKSNIVGRSIVGGLIFGGAGAVIGGLSGKSKQIKKVSNVGLKITTMRIKKPSYQILFFNARQISNNTKESIDISQGIFKAKFESAMKNLKKWNDLFNIIIDINQKQRLNKSHNNLSIADELIKLTELKDKKIISAEEFEKQKKKLLDS